MTQSGIILLPLILALLALPRIWAIPALYVGAVFADASIANVAGRPIPVSWFVGIVVIARELWLIAVGSNRLRLDVLHRLLPLFVLALACCLSLILALVFFQNAVLVLPGSAGFDSNLAEPFRLIPENTNQLVYMGLITALVTLLVNLAADLDSATVNRWIDHGMRWSCAVATLAVAWHVASFSTGVWFPDQFFHSSIKSGAWDQGGFGDLANRPSGSFSEPSELTYYFGMLVFYFYQQWRLRGRLGDQMFLVVSLAVLVLSTSTTAYVLITLFAALAVADAALGYLRRRRDPGRRRGLRGAHIVTALVLATALCTGAWILNRNQEVVQAVYQEQLLGKSQSRSYAERSTADRMAWRIFIDTYGIGAGLGSHRPNSGLMSVISGPGLLGMLALLWFLARNLGRPGESALERSADGDPSKPVRWATIGLLLTHAISGPNIQPVLLWTSLALSVAFHLHRGAKAPSPRATKVAGTKLGLSA